MRRILIAAAAVLLCASLCGCSVVKDVVGADKYDKLTQKLGLAWSEVGKDALAELTDDAWREFGFGSSLGWPEDSVAAALPKLRDGSIVHSYSSEDGGYISAAGINDGEYSDYLLKFTDIGYKKTVDTPPFTVLLTCDGTYVGFIRGGGGQLSLLYADSYSRLTEITGIAEAK